MLMKAFCPIAIWRLLIDFVCEGLIEAMHAWCKEEPDHMHPHLIRFMAHLVLFLRSLDVVSAWVSDFVCNMACMYHFLYSNYLLLAWL